jgi:hypothetical protein
MHPIEFNSFLFPKLFFIWLYTQTRCMTFFDIKQKKLKLKEKIKMALRAEIKKKIALFSKNCLITKIGFFKNQIKNKPFKTK